MSLSTKSFATMVADFAVAVQGSSNKLVDFTTGAILRAISEASSGVGLWLQGLILQLLAITRASTSSDDDLDSWFADFNFKREDATAATGIVTFARYTVGVQALVPIGATVQTTDGSLQFLVTLDSSNAAYSSTLSGYVIDAEALSVSVPVKATTNGTSGNVSAGSVNTLATAIAGVDTVTNASGFGNGADAESDTAARARFIQYIASLSKATVAAVAYAMTSVQQGVDYSLVENEQYNGTEDNGYFYGVVDDGSGAPDDDFLATEAAAVEAVRPIGIRYGMFKPVVVSADVGMTITTASEYSHSIVVSAVVDAIESYINALGVGVALSYTKLVQIAYDALPDAVTNVQGLLLNGGTADLTATSKQAIKAGTITVA